MPSFHGFRRRATLAAALMTLMAAAPLAAEGTTANAGSATPASPQAWSDPRPGAAEPITLRDIAESNAKVKMAYSALMDMWTSHFDDVGERFVLPQLLRYRGTVRTSCGVMPQDNAAYCPARNAIYFDEVFLAAMAKRIGAELGTDGDMAAVGVIAHEVGHAVAIQLGYASRFTYDNEATADCLAGAFARQSKQDGYLEKGDLEEAFLGMALAGDPDPATLDRDITLERRRAHGGRMSHGTHEQRMQNFGAGLEGGPGSCLADFDR